jgi:hypothetical protein
MTNRKSLSIGQRVYRLTSNEPIIVLEYDVTNPNCAFELVACKQVGEVKNEYFREDELFITKTEVKLVALDELRSIVRFYLDNITQVING